MKKLFSMTTIALATLAFALTGCGDDKPDVKMNMTSIPDLKVAESVQLFVTSDDVKVVAEWASSDDAIAKVVSVAGAPEVSVEGVAEGAATITATYGGTTYTCAVTVIKAEEPKEDVPNLTLPGDGNIMIAVRVPAGTCNGVYGVGTDNAWGVTDTETAKFVAVEGTTSWYTLTLPVAGDRQLKVVAKPETAGPDWIYQWGKNNDEATNVTMVEGRETTEITIDNSENGGEVKLTSFTNEAGNVIYYFDIASWSTAPCAELVPAGSKTFAFTLEGDSLSEFIVDSVAIAGNFAEYAWDASRKMTKSDAGVWEWTGEYPDNFQFKAIAINAEGTQYWADGGNTLLSNEDGNPVQKTFTFAKKVIETVE